MEKSQNLDQQINNLQIHADQLRSQIMATGRGITTHAKRKQQNQEANLRHEISILKGKRNSQREAQAFGKIHDLFKTSNRIIVVEVNGMRVKPDANLNVNFKFTCGHVKKTHIARILYHLQEHPNKQALLAAWEARLSTNGIITASFNCQQCRQAITKKFNLFRRSSPKDIIGTCSVTMQII